MNVNNTNIKRIFISHSKKDSAFGDAVVKLLRGIGLDQKQISTQATLSMVFHQAKTSSVI